MRRKWLAVLCLLAVAVLLTGCNGQQDSGTQTFTEVTQYLGPTNTATPSPTANTSSDGNSDSVFSNNPYMVDNTAADADADFTAADALGEEDSQDNGVYDDTTIVYGQADADATVYPYAGSTPIPLLPIDAPTPTPRAPLSFTYVAYNVPSLGLSFEGPAGWVADASVDGIYTLTEPEQQMKDNQLGIVTLSASPVTANYSETELGTEIKSRLNNISATNFVEWKPSYTATRYLMGSKGVYANYSGTLADGTEIGGRLHAVTIDKVLYCIEITYPYGFKDDYLNIFSKVRETISRTGN